jgi:hypothetical protein
VCPRINGSMRHCVPLKTFANVVLQTEHLPDLAYIVDGQAYDRDLAAVDDDLLPRLLFEDNMEVFVKYDDSMRGDGVVRITEQECDIDALRSGPDCVIQYPVHQHPALERIVSGSVATIRITTVRGPDGTVQARAGYLRVSRKGESHVSSATHLRIPIEMESGRLTESGYMADWSRVEVHPDSGFSFAGASIPCFEDALRLCVLLHGRSPHLGCIGWDTTVDCNGVVVLLEWNASHNDIKFSEATAGPCFKGLGWENLRV